MLHQAVTIFSAAPHAKLTRTGQTVIAMMTHRMRISRQLRAARTSAMTAEQRREALRAAEQAAARKDDRPSPDAGAAHDATPSQRTDSRR